MRASRRQSEMERQTEAFRRRVLAMEAQSTQLLSASYADVLTQLEPRILALSEQIAAAQAAGEPVGISWLFQQERYLELRKQVIALMNDYGQAAKVVTTATQRVIVREALFSAGEMLLPISGGDGSAIAELARGWASVPDESIVNLVGAMQESTPLGQTIAGYGQDAAAEVQKALVRGLALGDSAAVTARAVQQALGITRTRAELLTRTETMRAARAATMAAYQASGVVKMVRWSASLSARTCGYCLSRHGKLFPLGTTMVTHPACRCSWSPWSPAWDEPWQSGESWLSEQSVKVQRQVLGVAGQEVWAAGHVSLDDFAKTGFDKDWGPTGHFGGLAYALQQAGRSGRIAA